MIYYVIEFQTGTSGAAIVNTYTDPALADQKFHQIMAAASVSSVPKHGAMIINGDMEIIQCSVAPRYN